MSIRSRRLDWWLWAVVGLLAALQWGLPEAFSELQTYGTAVLFLGLGVPHGALDALIVQRTRPDMSRTGFYGAYMGAMAAVCLLWATAPAVAFWGFMLLSAWHLGESDFESGAVGVPGANADPAVPRRVTAHRLHRAGLGLSRGLLVLGLPWLLHPEAVRQVLAGLHLSIDLDPSPTTAVCGSVLLVGQHLAWLWATRPEDGRFRWGGTVGHEILQTAVLTFMLAALPPLLAFTLYLTLWHAVAHLLRTRAMAGRSWSGWLSWAGWGAPIAIASSGTVAVSWVALGGLHDPYLASAPILVGISALTLPHAVVVAGMSRNL